MKYTHNNIIILLYEYQKNNNHYEIHKYLESLQMHNDYTNQKGRFYFFK
jgi:hypothetical protein